LGVRRRACDRDCVWRGAPPVRTVRPAGTRRAGPALPRVVFAGVWRRHCACASRQ
jgi:hypothetical protein